MSYYAKMPIRWARLLILAGAGMLAAQDAPVMRVSVTLVQLDAVVRDKDGRQVKDLTASDFLVYEEGMSRQVARSAYIPLDAPQAVPPTAPGQAAQRTARDQVTRSYAIVVDDFALPFEEAPAARRALHQFIDEQVQPGDLVAILSLGRSMGALQQFTTDKRKLHAAVDNVRANISGLMGAAVGGVAADSLNRLSYIVSVLRDLPGHKSILLIGSGNIVALRPGAPPALGVAINKLFDHAMRASVSIYGIDARPTIQLNTSSAQDFAYLCNSTGGKYLGGLSNGFSEPLKRAMEEQQGYYLLAFSPDSRLFTKEYGGSNAFRKVQVKVKRSGYHVSATPGYFSEPDKEPEPQKPVPEMVKALMSPFGVPDIETGMTAGFFDGEAGPGIAAYIDVKTAGLTITKQEDRYVTGGEVVIMAFDDTGLSAYRDGVRFSARLNEADYKLAMSNGLLFTFRLPVKKPGAYDVRATVRDEASGKMGTSGSFLRVPQLKRDRVAISGILLQSPPLAGDSGADLRGATALRIFRPGDEITYAYQVLNPKLDRANPQPKLQARLRILREGKPVFEGKPETVPSQGETTRIPAGGSLKLGPGFTPGDYVLQIGLTDLAAESKYRETSQVVDFYVR